MTVWALSEARLRGYSVDAENLGDTVKWTKALFVGQFSKPRDPRPGYNYVSMPGMYLATMSDTLPVLSREEVGRVAVHLERHQEADGVWPVPPPDGNGAPPTFESSETLAHQLLAFVQLRTETQPRGSPEPPSRENERSPGWRKPNRPKRPNRSRSACG